MIGKVTEYLLKNGNKLGIDMDEPTEFEFLKSYFNAKYLFPDNKIDVFRSSNGHGYHIIINGMKSTLKVREMLCDCEQRREYSEMRSGLKNQVTGDEIVDDVMFFGKIVKTKSGKIIKRHRKKIDDWNIIIKQQDTNFRRR